MTVLDANMYRDPMLWLQRKQEADAHKAAQRKAKCGQCIHYKTLVINFKVNHACDMGRYDWRRCMYFQEGSK